MVSKMKYNLIFASKMTSRGCKILVERDNTVISGKNFAFICERRGGLYVLEIDNIVTAEMCNVTVYSEIWHGMKRLFNLD